MTDIKISGMRRISQNRCLVHRMAMRVSRHGDGPSRLAQSLMPRRALQSNSHVFKVSEEVRAAVNERRPVVSLESTIYTHGFPYPDNLHLATRLESLVRHNGGVPAHCALLDGVATVGLQQHDMQRLLEDRTARKVSRRDLAPVLGSVRYSTPCRRKLKVKPNIC